MLCCMLRVTLDSAMPCLTFLFLVLREAETAVWRHIYVRYIYSRLEIENSRVTVPVPVYVHD